MTRLDVIPADAADAVARATLVLDGRGLVAFPAGGRYAVGADALDEDAVAAARHATRRPADAAVSVVVPDLESARHVAQVTPAARRIAAEAFPGHVVLLLPVAMTAPENLADAAGRVAVRVPPDPFARALAQHFGPVTAPRAVPGDAPPPRALADVRADGVSVGVDAGTLADVPRATVVDATGAVAKVLRQGAVPADAITVAE